MSAPGFKIGDRVRIVKPLCSTPIGQATGETGTIIAREDIDWPPKEDGFGHIPVLLDAQFHVNDVDRAFARPEMLQLIVPVTPLPPAWHAKRKLDLNPPVFVDKQSDEHYV